MSFSSTRLNKYISESGICSRREADKHIENGRVLINGVKARIGDQVKPGDIVIVNGLTIEPRTKEDEIFIALNKPVGITSTTESNDPDNIVDFVNHSQRIFPIGRLDKDSQGLIFLTNNGDIVNRILRAGNQHEKEYLVTVDKPITEEFIQGMAGGVPMLGVTTKKCKVFRESTFVFRIILIQGLNRQIRRMCEHFGYNVVKLERIRIMNISLKNLPLGDWRELTTEEMNTIYRLVETSSSESPVKPKKEKKSFRKDGSSGDRKRQSPGATKHRSSSGSSRGSQFGKRESSSNRKSPRSDNRSGGRRGRRK